jgi:hypothetical protein
MPFCGTWIWGLCFLTVAGLVSIILGLAAYLLARRKKSPTRELIAALSLVGGFFLMVCGCFVYYGWCSSDFYCNRGFADDYRIPLKYPYQISAHGFLDYGCLDIWHDEGSCIVWGITHYTVNDSVMVGRTKPSCPDCPEKWFSFTFDSKELVYYDSKQAFIAACQDLGFSGEPVLRSISEHFDED